jgi:hypothetical protein
MENRISSNQLMRIKGHFQEKYGYEMDTFSTTILSELNQEFEKINTEMKAITAEINEASSKINGSIKHIQFTKSKVAFWYAAGSNMPKSIAIIITAFLLYSAFIYVQRNPAKEPQKTTKTSRN